MARYKQTNNLKNTDAAYIAGLIDGEGTITLSKRHKNENRHLVVSISNNELDILKHVLNITGVGVLHKKRTYKESHYVNFTYKVSNRQAYTLLEQITPYLKSYKRKRSLLALKKYLVLTPRNGKYTRQITMERDIFVTDFLNITRGRNSVILPFK